MNSRISAPPPFQHRQVLETGTVLRGYRLEFLSAGGMGVVYRAQRDGRTTVLKEVPGDQPQLVLSLNQEKAMLERLRHPGIVGFHELFEENGYYYLALEYIEGQTLQQYAEAFPPSCAQVRHWGAQLCDIFEYLHAQKPPIIYRDLKPENVMVEAGKLRLIDFGIARVHKGTRSNDTELMGSLLTASPEHYGGSETDARSDIYTLGATLYDLLTGGRRRPTGPFQFSPIRELRPDVPPDLEAILQKCLQFEPERRFCSVSELRAALRGDSPAPLLPSARKSASKRVFPVGVALGALLLASTGAAAWRLLPVSTPPAQVAAPVDTGLRGDVFAWHREGDRVVFTLGEDIGLFALAAPEIDRAGDICTRLNQLYHQSCPLCGQFKLGPNDFLVGRQRRQDTAELRSVLFYAHNHDGQLVDTPVVLSTLSLDGAAELSTSPQFGLTHWRNLLRDVVQVSRARETRHSELGVELSHELLGLRRHLPDDSSIVELNELLRALPNRKIQQLKTVYRTVPPDLRREPDRFFPKLQIHPLSG